MTLLSSILARLTESSNSIILEPPTLNLVLRGTPGNLQNTMSGSSHLQSILVAVNIPIIFPGPLKGSSTLGM